MEGTSESENLSALVALVHRRWNIPILAELAERGGAKFVTLASALDISRASLTASLKALIELELVAKNPGHGHPMRPEYILTGRGRRSGEICLRLTKSLTNAADVELALRKWTLPVVAAIGDDLRRFSELRRLLPQATSRAVALALKPMSERNWIRRSVIDDYPPTAGYALKPKGRRILRLVRELLEAQCPPATL